MKAAFSGGANLSGMDGRRDLLIKLVAHRAYVKVDEKGTEAAAATGAVGGPTALRHEIHFKADHPFLFTILDRKSGNILFLGRVTDPLERS